MGKKWRTWKANLKARLYDSSLSVDEMLALQAETENRVNPIQFKKLATHWCTEEYKVNDHFTPFYAVKVKKIQICIYLFPSASRIILQIYSIHNHHLVNKNVISGMI